LKHNCVTKEGQEMAALYALGALSQHEARAFDVHLREGCPACGLELKQFDEVVSLIGESVEPAAAPSYVRELLTLRIQREVLDAPAPAASARGASVIPFPEPSVVSQIPVRVGTVVEQPRERTVERPRELTRERTPQWTWLPWAVAAAFLVAFLFSFVAWRTSRSALQGDLDQSRAWASAVSGENAELKEKLRKESAASTELAQINSVLGSPGWRTFQLQGQDPAPSSSATVYWDVQGSRWVVTAELPPAPEGKVYQLWFVTPDAKISAGLIRPDLNGHGFASFQVPQDMGSLAAAAITLEPEGGSEQPTMPIYIMGTV
jgi:anti-sigma-K factor RskA